MSTYDWLRRRYMTQLEEEIEEMIENDNVDPDTAGDYYTEKLEEWDAGYGDYMYDMIGDR